MKFLVAGLLAATVWGGIVEDVRAFTTTRDFTGAERTLANFQKSSGITNELALAASWMGRDALAVRDYDRADRYASEAGKLVFAALNHRRLDSVPLLPAALGATIEVHAQVMNARGDGASAVEYLKGELKTYSNTSLVERISKNINLISLEGKPAPELDLKEFVGVKPQTLATLKGHTVLMFFWAHWCPDCKSLAATIGRLSAKYGPQGLVTVAPTRYYGFVAGREDASPASEKLYIEEVRKRYYPELASIASPLSNANFATYGCSSTPTLALLDSKGIVRWYHPGLATEKELEAKISQYLR